MKAKLLKIFLPILYSFIYFGIAWILALLLSGRYNWNLVDTMSYMGILSILAGILMLLKGNSSWTGLQGLGLRFNQYRSPHNMETPKTEEETTDYYKNFREHSPVTFSRFNLILLLGGGIIFAFTVFVLS